MSLGRVLISAAQCLTCSGKRHDCYADESGVPIATVVSVEFAALIGKVLQKSYTAGTFNTLEPQWGVPQVDGEVRLSSSYLRPISAIKSPVLLRATSVRAEDGIESPGAMCSSG